VDLFIKTIVAFCIGAGAIAGAQALWLSSIKQQLHAERAPVMPKPMPSVDASKIVKGINPPPLDPNLGKNAALGTINRQINQSIRAGDLVPRPRSFPGVPRY